MITVFKYELPSYSEAIKLPVGTEILSIAFQRDTLCFWAKVDTEAETEERNFEAFGTGYEMPYNMGTDYKFVGTAHMDNGLVFHAFERIGL